MIIGTCSDTNAITRHRHADLLAKQAFAVAERQKLPVDQIVALALSAQLAAWKGSDDMATRAKRANLPDFDRLPKGYQSAH